MLLVRGSTKLRDSSPVMLVKPESAPKRHPAGRFIDVTNSYQHCHDIFRRILRTDWVLR